MASYTYVPQSVEVIWTPSVGAPLVLSGFAPGDFITAEYATSQRVTTTSNFALTVHTLTTDQLGTVTATLQAAAPTAKLLYIAALAQEIAATQGSPLNTGTLVIREPGATNSLAVLNDAVLSTVPSQSFGDGGQPTRAFAWTGALTLTAESPL